MNGFEKHYRRIVAEQIAKYLVRLLQDKAGGHRACVTDLPKSLMDDVCGRVRDVAHQIETYILADEPRTALEIGATKLIERRNVSDKVLLVFIPSGLKTAAEDSYGEHTFENLSVLSAFYELRRELIRQLDADFPYVEKIVNSPHARRQPVENVVRYLLAVQSGQEDPQAPGRYLHYLNLVPDLGLTAEQAEARIDRNCKKVEILTQPDKPLLAKIEALKLKPDTIQGELFRQLCDNEGADPATWLPQTLEWGLTFDRWPEPDVHLPDEPPTLTFDPLSKFKGMSEEGGDFIAYTTTPATASWRLSPANPDYLSHYVLTLLREEREDEELLPSKRVAANRRSCKLDLKNVELDEDEGRAAARLEVRAISLDGETLVSDLSDPFWIEKGIEGTVTEGGDETRRNPHGDEVRSVAEALLIGALRLRAKGSRKAELAVRHDRSGWASSSKAKGAVQDVYRIRLTTNDLFHLKFVPILRDLERNILDRPTDLRAFRLALPSLRPAISQQLESESIDLPAEQLTTFTLTRAALFEAVVRTTPGAVVEVADLRPHAALVLDYARAYQDLLGLGSPTALACLDTLQVQMPDAQALILAPTHPLRMLWLLQYQRLLGQWTDGILDATSEEAAHLIDRASLDRITSLNAPAFLATGPKRIWVNTDNLNLFWSIFLPAPVERSREALSFLYRALNVPTGKADVSTIRAEQLAERIALYLDQHPYVRTLALNIVNPGDGLIILDTLRHLQRQLNYREINYDLRFFGGGSYDQLGVAFDELMNETDERRGQDVDDAFLAANPNPLLPKLTFAKHRVEALTCTRDRTFDAHLTILLDHFRSSVHTVPLQPAGGSSSLYGLLTEFQADYRTKEGIVWSRSIQPSLCPGLETDDAVAPLLFELHTTLLQAMALISPTASQGEVSAIQLRLSSDDLALISQVHAFSDWVLTVDRNFGIEYFDNPEPLTSYRESYLIDYTPEFLSDVGHRLIVSTAWLGEIETLLARALRDLGLLSERLRPLDMLNALRSLSGRIALRVLSQPAHSEPLIGLGLAQIIQARSGRLQDSVLVPALAHPDLLGPNNGNTLSLVRFEGHTLYADLLAVRFCKGTFVGDEYIAREEVRAEVQQVASHILAQLAPAGQRGLLDQALRNKAWAGVLGFYLGRAIRYGLLTANSQAVLHFQAGLEALRKNEASVVVGREGLIFNLHGVTKPAEDYHGVRLQVIGRDELAHFTGAVQAKIAEQPEASAPLPLEAEQTVAVREALETSITELQEVGRTEVHADLLKIELGASTDTGRPVVWAPYQPYPKRLTNQHILIVGKSGSGKTQTIMVLVYELWGQRVPSLILDFHGEYCDASSGPFRDAMQAEVFNAAQGIPINPLTVPPDPITGQQTDYRNVVYQVTESLADIFGLGDIQKRILKRAIENAYTVAGFSRDSATWGKPAPLFSAVWDQLRAIEREERGTARNLVARVEPLFESEVFRGEDQIFEDLLHKVTIVRLSGLANKELRTAISRFFLQKVYEKMLALGPSQQQRLFCVIDEAHKLSHDPTITDLIKEARKYGVGLILSSQETRDFDRSIFANTGTLVALQLEIEDARIMAENLGLLQSTERAAAIEIILRQRPGQALVRNNHYQPYTQVQIVPLAQRLRPIT